MGYSKLAATEILKQSLIVIGNLQKVLGAQVEVAGKLALVILFGSLKKVLVIDTDVTSAEWQTLQDKIAVCNPAWQVRVGRINKTSLAKFYYVRVTHGNLWSTTLTLILYQNTCIKCVCETPTTTKTTAVINRFLKLQYMLPIRFLVSCISREIYLMWRPYN